MAEDNISNQIKSLGDQIKKLSVVITEIPSTYPDAGFTAYSRGDLVKGGYLNYYNLDNTIATAGTTNPNDFDSPVYNRERVYESLQRKSPFLQVINHGTDNLFVIVSHAGTTSFTAEVRIRPGETKEYLNVYELRLRSPTQGNSYTITEYYTEEVCCPTLSTTVASILAQLDVALSTRASEATLLNVRWGRNVSPTWIHAAEVIAPVAGTALVTRVVTAGTVGYIYGFFIESQEANDFLINWTSGGIARSIRITFAGRGAIENVDQVAINEGLSADASTIITITNVTTAIPTMIYQARLLYTEV